MKTKKKIPLPIWVLIIGAAIGLVFAGIGVYKQIDTKKVNEARYNEAYSQALANKEILEKRYQEITNEIGPLKNQYEAKKEECDAINMDSSWGINYPKCQREANEINSQISELETEKFQIENYDNTVYYTMIKPMAYQIFYIIGGSVFGAAALAAFIIYLVKGKKTYD